MIDITAFSTFIHIFKLWIYDFTYHYIIFMKIALSTYYLIYMYGNITYDIICLLLNNNYYHYYKNNQNELQKLLEELI